MVNLGMYPLSKDPHVLGGKEITIREDVDFEKPYALAVYQWEYYNNFLKKDLLIEYSFPKLTFLGQGWNLIQKIEIPVSV